MEIKTVVVIPTKRKPPLKTLQSFAGQWEALRSGDGARIPLIILADPDVAAEIRLYYEPLFTVFNGKQGSIPQALEVYRVAAREGYTHVFRMDDDLQPHFFVDVDGDYPSISDVIYYAEECIKVTKTTLAGFANTSRRDWLGDPGNYRRGAGLIHGGAQLAKATVNPERYLDPLLPAYDDVYRSAAHRRECGAVGVVSWIGLDKRESLRDTVTPKSPETIQQCKDIILGAFPDMVTCRGERVLDNGRQVIPNWKMKGRAR